VILHKPETLAKILGYPLEELLQVIEEIKIHPRKYYYSYQKISTKNGKKKVRNIDPSRDKLRDVQNKLNKKILSKIKLPEHIQGSVKGKSNISNAKLHRSKKFHFLTDLSNFFPFVTNKLVFRTLCSCGFSPSVSRVITQLTTFKGHLPQGATTSSTLANLVGLKFDIPIIEICQQNNIIYSRYVDDLTFSSDTDFKHVIEDILKIITSQGFLYSHAKTLYKEGKVEITGCLDKTNGRLTLTLKQQAKLDDPAIAPASRAGLEAYRRIVENS